MPLKINNRMNCRFCSSLDNITIDNDIILSCQCKNPYTHQHCLDKIRYSSVDPIALTQCETCNTSYQYDFDNNTKKNVKAKILFGTKIFIHTTIILLMTLLIYLLGFLLSYSQIYHINVEYRATVLICETIIFSNMFLQLVFATYLMSSHMVTLCKKILDENFENRPLNQNVPYALFLILYDDNNHFSNKYQEISHECYFPVKWNNKFNYFSKWYRNLENKLLLLPLLFIIVVVIYLILIGVINLYCLYKILYINTKKIYKDSHYDLYKIKNLDQA